MRLHGARSRAARRRSGRGAAAAAAAARSGERAARPALPAWALARLGPPAGAPRAPGSNGARPRARGCGAGTDGCDATAARSHGASDGGQLYVGVGGRERPYRHRVGPPESAARRGAGGGLGVHGARHGGRGSPSTWALGGGVVATALHGPPLRCLAPRRSRPWRRGRPAAAPVGMSGRPAFWSAAGSMPRPQEGPLNPPWQRRPLRVHRAHPLGPGRARPGATAGAPPRRPPPLRPRALRQRAAVRRAARPPARTRRALGRRPPPPRQFLDAAPCQKTPPRPRSRAPALASGSRPLPRPRPARPQGGGSRRSAPPARYLHPALLGAALRDAHAACQIRQRPGRAARGPRWPWAPRDRC
jgi:hypothetical protein